MSVSTSCGDGHKIVNLVKFMDMSHLPIEFYACMIEMREKCVEFVLQRTMLKSTSDAFPLYAREIKVNSRQGDARFISSI